MNVKTNIGAKFLALIDRCFPKGIEAVVDPLPDALGHGWRMVGVHMDIVDDLPQLHVVSVAAVQQVEGHIQVVHLLLVHLHFQFQAVGFKDVVDLLLHPLGLLALQLRHAQHVVPVQPSVHLLQALQLVQQEQPYEI